MSKSIPYSAVVKVKVPTLTKATLQAIADKRHLKLADITREAYRDYLAKPENSKVWSSVMRKHFAQPVQEAA